MSRFALDPRWLIYLPPTMSPSETSQQPDWLEYPAEAFAYYRAAGRARAWSARRSTWAAARCSCVCRDRAVARTPLRRVRGRGAGRLLHAHRTPLLRRRCARPCAARRGLRRARRAPVSGSASRPTGSAWTPSCCRGAPRRRGCCASNTRRSRRLAQAALDRALAAAEAAQARGVEVGAELARAPARAQRENIERYADAYRAYCWETQWAGGRARRAISPARHARVTTYFDRDHLWHMAELARLAAADPLFLATAYRAVDAATMPTPAPTRPPGGWS